MHRSAAWTVLALACLVAASPPATAATAASPSDTTATATAETGLLAPFGSGMVLPRNRQVPIRGMAAAGASIEIRGGWSPEVVARGRAGADGRWSVPLNTGDAGGPYAVTITVRHGDLAEELRLEDVLLGEVWLAGRQSNMEMSLAPGGGLGGVADWASELERAVAPRVRMFDVPNRIAWSPQERLDAAVAWTAVSPETAGAMSAVAWFFAERLHGELGVPIGIVNATVGGTRVEAWMSEAEASRHERLTPWLDLVRGERAEPGFIAGLRRDRDAAARVSAERRDPGIRDRWMDPAVDDSDWAEVEVGRHWPEPPLSGHDGFVWMRRTVTLPADAPLDGPWTLWLGAVDDRDDTWVNGELVGRTDGENLWNQPRRYEVPAGGLKPGRNLIAVRVRDNSGPGGMIGPAAIMRLEPARGHGDAGEPSAAAIRIDGRWLYRTSLTEAEIRQPAPLPGGSAGLSDRADRNLPTVLHAGMIEPLGDFPFRGAIFYQGESNVGDPLYGRLLPSLIADWRSRFAGDRDADWPFLMVQIAPFGYCGSPDVAALVREAQRRTAASVPGCGLVVTTDVGARHEIHPIAKRPVGERLAELALAGTYGLDRGIVRSPEPVSIAFDGGEAIVRLAPVGGGLEILGDGAASRAGFASHWQIRDADGRWHRADVRIDGDTLRVRARPVTSATGVRFGWGASPEPNLFAATGLPVVPFTSEPMPGEEP